MIPLLIAILAALSLPQPAAAGQENSRGLSARLASESPRPDAAGLEAAPSCALDDSARPVSVVVTIETGEIRERIMGSRNNFGADRATLEQSLGVTGSFTDAIIDVDFRIPMTAESVLKLRVGGGAEELGSHFRIGPDNVVIGDPAGGTEQDFIYGLSATWEAAVEFRYRVGHGPFDVALSADYRGGGDDVQDALSENSLVYWRLRGGIWVGWAVTDNIRPYVGMRYTKYRGRYSLKDSTTGQVFTLNLTYDTPVDVAVGVEFTSGPVVGALELDLVGTLSVLVSVGVQF
jgi:hypothetical protein